MNILIKLINDVKALCNTIITAVNAIKTKTDTITADLFTSTHASRIDATISSRQASWGATSTHSSRIDASISSRALETTAQAIKAKTDLLSAGYIKSSSTVRLNVDAERVSSSPLTYMFLMKSTGTVNISFDLRTVSTSSTNFNISVRALGIEIYTSTATAGNSTYVTKTLNSVPVYGGVVEVVINSSGIQFKSKSFKVMYDDDTLTAPTLL